ncbi:hypothetical protein HMPREF1598_03530 [Escherichia coli 907710]|nr:hypothetical protein HMPREF1598_03530 [Escherichia coli 907710]
MKRLNFNKKLLIFHELRTYIVTRSAFDDKNESMGAVWRLHRI